MPRLLITGGAGFIGSTLVRHWCKQHPGDRVLVVDALTYAGRLESIQPLVDCGRIDFVHADICDAPRMQALLAAFDPELVVHLAAESHVDRSILGPQAFVRTNIEGTHALLVAVREAWAGCDEGRRFLQVSTDEVYGSLSPEAAPFHEGSPYAPRSPYAASKAAADHLVRAYHHTYGLPTLITSCSNNYGPYQLPEKLIPLLITRALQGLPLPIYGDGQQVRDWLYVEDHCRGLELALLRGDCGATYNLGGRCERQNLEVVLLLCALLEEAFAADPALRVRFPQAPAASFVSLVTHVTDRPGHDRRYSVDCSRAAQELGFAPQTGFEDGLRHTVRWYLDHEAWWRGSGASLLRPPTGS